MPELYNAPNFVVSKNENDIHTCNLPNNNLDMYCNECSGLRN